MSNEALTGDQRCWPCTVANTAVGLLVGWTPVTTALLRDDPFLIAGATVWGEVVSLFTADRLY